MATGKPPRAVPRDAKRILVVDDDAAPFLEWTFLDALEQSGSVGPHVGWRPLHLTAHRDGRLVGALGIHDLLAARVV